MLFSAVAWIIYHFQLWFVLYSLHSIQLNLYLCTFARLLHSNHFFLLIIRIIRFVVLRRLSFKIIISFRSSFFKTSNRLDKVIHLQRIQLFFYSFLKIQVKMIKVKSMVNETKDQQPMHSMEGSFNLHCWTCSLSTLMLFVNHFSMFHCQ